MKEFFKITTIGDIMNEESGILSWEVTRRKNDIANRSDLWLYYCGITQAIPKYWKVLLKGNGSLNVFGNLALASVVESKKPSRKIYDWINKNRKTDTISKYCNKWYSKLEVTDQGLYDYMKLFKQLHNLTQVVKLKDFQYRLLCGKIFTNDILVKWKKVASNICNICGKDKQTIVHLIVYCEYSCKIWQSLQEWFPEVEFTKINIMCNTVHSNNKHILNLITLITKQFIFRCKCMNTTPNITAVIKEIKLNYEIDKINEDKSNTLLKWGPVLNNKYLIL